VKWYRLSAEPGSIGSKLRVFGGQGYDNAQYSLGLAYWHAEGVGLDRAEAVKWIQLAAEQGHDLSIEFLAKL